MKKLFTFSILLACISLSSFAQVIVTNGLVASYPFNGNAYDESSNGNNGTVNGASLTTDRFGNANSAYSFDGVDNYILVGDPIPTSLQIQNEITLEAWIYATQYPTDNLGLIVGSQCDGCGNVGASIFLDGRTNPDGQTAPAGHIQFRRGRAVRNLWRCRVSARCRRRS